MMDWQAGAEEELHFWRSYLLRFGHRYTKSHKLRADIRALVGNQRSAHIADCGAGAVSLIGDRIFKARVEMVASDVLADEYDALCAELDIKRFVPVERQDMARMSYPDESFDVVWCRNALDHCVDPWAAVQEMLRICKPGGWVLLRHIACEGRRMRYHGLHAWNVDTTPDGDCEFWTDGRAQAFRLSECVPGFQVRRMEERKPKVMCDLHKPLERNEWWIGLGR